MGGSSLEVPDISFSALKGRSGEGGKKQREAQSKVLHREESHKYGGDILMYRRGAFKMTQGVGD